MVLLAVLLTIAGGCMSPEGLEEAKAAEAAGQYDMGACPVITVNAPVEWGIPVGVSVDARSGYVLTVFEDGHIAGLYVGYDRRLGRKNVVLEVKPERQSIRGGER